VSPNASMSQNANDIRARLVALNPTLVIQSHRMPLPAPWLERCLLSVKGWAQARDFDYRFVDDAIFTPLADWLLDKTAERPTVAADFARLVALRDGLNEGYETVVWCDADFVVFAPERLDLPEESFAFGREVWVDVDATGRSRASIKVHNAFMFFRRGNPFLDFYVYAAQRLLGEHEGPMVPQLIGPKFLTALHNMVQFPVVEAAAMLSPAVAQDLLGGGGPSLELYRRRCITTPAGVNLCASLSDVMSDADYSAVIELLLEGPGLAPAQA
jgi:hypothetical protein